MALKKQQEEDEDDATPSWAVSILKSLTEITTSIEARVSALEKSNVESSTGTPSEGSNSGNPARSGERKPKRGGFLSAWDRD